MKNKNILICSAGRRVELVKAFQTSIKKYLSNGKIFCTDMEPELSSACMIADNFFKVPRVTDTNYIQMILDICHKNQISLVIPTIDTELLVLSSNRELFKENGITLLVSDIELIKFCRDKRETSKLFRMLNIDTPLILDKESLSFPCFCKPYDGSCSVGAFAVNERSELTEDILQNPKNMFMELVPPTYSEYTIDGYFTETHQLKCLVPRKRIEVRAGEVSKGITKKNFVYDYLLERVSELHGARGCITFQLFVNDENMSVKGLEINPRFGGGYPLSNAAGATFTDWIIKEYFLNQEISFFGDWENNLLMLRYDASVLVHAD